MKIRVLYSGGKDSSLSSILLEPFFDVELVTFGFEEYGTWVPAKKAASVLGFPHKVIPFEGGVIKNAMEIILEKGYPKDALNYLHDCALKVLATDSEFLADGTKREDRAPVMGNRDIRSLEDRFGVKYVRPLAGYGSSTINLLASRYLDFEMLPSEAYPASDFEVGLRRALAEQHGPEKVARIFPANHTHSIVIRRKSFEQKD
jgi:hypothetical protein